MRTLPAALVTAALTVGLAVPAGAHPSIDLAPPIGVDLTHESTDNIAFVARLHEHFGTAGGALTTNENYTEEDGTPIPFYVVTDSRGVFTYDVRNPEAPALLDVELVNQVVAADGVVYPLPSTQTALGQEDPSTDGLTVLVDGSTVDGTMGLHIVDISNPENITVAGVVSGLTDHTWTCVTDVETGNGCGWAFGRDDNIVDIRDPKNPQKLATGWKTATGVGGYAHDLTEIRPGLVMHAGAEPVLMDTTDPANPVKLAHITLEDHDGPYDELYEDGRSWSTFGYHSVEWASGGEDDFITLGTELAPPGAMNNAGSDCNSDQSVIEVWDARPVKAAFAEMARLQLPEADGGEGLSYEDARAQAFGDGSTVKFVRLDSYMAFARGVFLTGQSPAHVLYCAHWMEPNPSWANGGTLAVGYYDRGVRFVDVAPSSTEAVDADGDGVFEQFPGQMTERGWFVGAEAYTGSAQWITDEVVYVMDYRRGMDIVKLLDAPATGVYTGTGSVYERSMTVAQMQDIGIQVAPASERTGVDPTLLVLGAGLAMAALVRRRRATVTVTD